METLGQVRMNHDMRSYWPVLAAATSLGGHRGPFPGPCGCICGLQRAKGVSAICDEIRNTLK